MALFLGLAHSCVVSQSSAPETKPVLQGVVVESLLSKFEGERVGLQNGDVLLAWARGDAKGDINSPFDLPYIRLEQASRGTVQLEGLRGLEKRTWTLSSDSWGIIARPNFQGDLLSIYREEQELLRTSKFAEMIEHQRKATPLIKRSGIPWLNPWFLSHSALMSSFQQHWEGYDDAYREAIQEAVDAGPLVRAELLREWAAGFLDRGDLINAETHYERALAEWRSLDPRGMAVSNVLRELGTTVSLQGNIVKAEACFREALTIAQALAPNSMKVERDLIRLGVFSQDRGDLANADDYYRKALAAQRKASPRNGDIALTLNNLGTLAHRRGDLAKAQDYYRESLAIAEELGVADINLADILSNFGECLLDRGNPQMAEVYANRALAMREKRAPEGLDVAGSLRDLGKIARVRGNLRKAEEYYLRALAIGEKITPLPPKVAGFLIGLGNVERDRRNFVKADEYYRRALAIAERAGPGGLDHAELAADLAGMLREQKRLDEAAILYRQAFAELESNAPALGGMEEGRSRYRAIHARSYREYMDLLIEQGQPELAFQVLEGSRARTLFEMLAQSQVSVRHGGDPSLLAREGEARQLLNAKSQYRIRLLTTKHTEEQLRALDQEITGLLRDYQQVEAEIRASSPSYAALTQPQALTDKEIQQLLDPESILLEYSLGDERSYVWIVGEKSLTVRELPKRADVESVARRVYQALTARNRPVKGETVARAEARWARTDREYERASSELSQIILEPVAEFLGNKRLLIVADGALQYIPFSALPAPAGATAAHARAATAKTSSPTPRSAERIPLAQEHEIVNLPSASVVAELRRQAAGRKQPAKTVAVLADPVFVPTDERVRMALPVRDQGEQKKWSTGSTKLRTAALPADLTRSLADVSASQANRSSLTRLLYTRQEAESIMSVTPAGQGMMAVDFQASREKAVGASLSQYRIVHFATHGLLNNVHPELSGLVFSLVSKQGRPQDGFLTLRDIYNLNLPVDLVVLSACDTGLGEEISGEGLVGLTRGFMYAGATRVVASLWSVNDVATSELMARFYKTMVRGGMRPAAALRAAQLQMRKQKRWSSPYYWAAFQLQGEWK
jgi:CHAT domain-containing protein/Tfp pilus assembly protein PilF